MLNSFFASGDFCRLLITFVNSMDPGQDCQNVSLDLDPNCLILLIAFLFNKVHFEKKVNRLNWPYDKCWQNLFIPIQKEYNLSFKLQ